MVSDTSEKADIGAALAPSSEQLEAVPPWVGRIMKLMTDAVLRLETAQGRLHSENADERAAAHKEVEACYMISEICKEYRVSRYRMESVLEEATTGKGKRTAAEQAGRGRPRSGSTKRGFLPFPVLNRNKNR